MFATVIITEPDPVPDTAVTVIFVPAVAAPALKVAIAWPFVPVVPWVTVKSPADVVKVTVTPLTSSLALSFAIAVIAAVVLPSDAIVVGLAVSVIDVTPLVVVPLLLPEPPLELELPAPLELPLELLLELQFVPQFVSSLPPQAESIHAAMTAMIDNLRISYILVKTGADPRQRLI